MLKPLLLIACCLAVVQADAQRVKRKGVEPVKVSKNKGSSYTLEQLTGRWQENARLDISSQQPVAFSDTLLIRIDGKKSEVRDATSMRIGMKGEAQILENNLLSVAGDEFTIMKLGEGTLTLSDGEFIREMKRKDVFFHETLGKLSVEAEKINDPVTIDIYKLPGRWLVYRRQAEAGMKGNEDVLIKSLEIKEIVSTSKANGEVAFYASDVTEKIPCSILITEGSMTIETDKHNWVFSTYKCDAGELVFGEKGKFVYYAKYSYR